MLKEHQYIFARINMALDLALGALSVALAQVLRNEVLGPYVFPNLFGEATRLADYAWLVLVYPVLLVVFLHHNKYYSSQRIRSFAQTFGAILISSMEASAAVAVVSFLLAPARSARAVASFENLSRGVVALLPLVALVLLTVKTIAVRQALFSLRQKGKNWRSLLLVGSGDTLRQFIRTINTHPFWGFRLAGIIDDSGREALTVESIPVIGKLDALIPYLEKQRVDEVVFIPARRPLEELSRYFEACEEMGVRTRLTLNFFQHTIARPVLDSLEELPVVTYSPTKEMGWALLLKYAFDRIAALVLIILASPFFLLLALIIKFTSQRFSDPVFYGQIRSGLNGKPFTLWKFRSMKIGAEKELDNLRAQNEMQGPVFKIKADPRITPIGRFLRKTSIDELPQLYNVLRGDMSMVGPRPPLPKEVEQYDRWQRRRLSMKPGITCLWQVMGRNQLSFDTWMKLDLEYIDNWSLLLDFRILMRTIYVVATGYGAM